MEGKEVRHAKACRCTKGGVTIVESIKETSR
jgi:hypothetical protein